MPMTTSPKSTYVDLRCPVGAKRLLGKARSTGESVNFVEGYLLELACRDCRNAIAALEGKKPSVVLHRFNVLGELVETEAEW